MKKKRSSRNTRTYKKTTRVPQRGTHKARRRLRDFKNLSHTYNVQMPFKQDMSEIEDHRTRRTEVPRLTNAMPAPVILNKKLRSPSPLKFADSRRTIECKRRRERRRIIFSIPGLRGKGSGSKKRRPPKFKGIRC